MTFSEDIDLDALMDLSNSDEVDDDLASFWLDMPDNIHQRYVAQFGSTFDWYQVKKNNDKAVIDKAVELMQAALSGDRDAINNKELGLKDVLTDDLEAQW